MSHPPPQAPKRGPVLPGLADPWLGPGRKRGGRRKAMSRAPATCWRQRALQRTTCLPPRQKPSTPCSAEGETEAWEVTWPRQRWVVMEKVGG